MGPSKDYFHFKKENLKVDMKCYAYIKGYAYAYVMLLGIGY